ncbi:hypothetical protein HAHE_23320 [Haloferula helveola]|uniref:5-bromo-4-chloroindolyl phosphate hydrolysis protein n=1 Tax=Haloferula helveola TaxID=490095 RepID=A0ABM7RAK5_9BACT|nr:hypothetical protein HAHE_23320 [Haloferula helveola]
MPKKDGRPTQVSLQDLTDQEAIFKAVRTQCIQSPLTVIPLALAAGVLLLTGAFSWGFLGVFASVVLGVVGAAAFVFNLWIRGETLAKRHVRWMMEQLKNDRRSALSEIREMCESIGLAEAAKEAHELSEAYSQYTEFLETRAEAKLGTGVGNRLGLAESARSAGVAHLRRAAEIHTALSGIDIVQLRQESEMWIAQKELPDANHSVLDSKLAAHSQQIGRYDQLAARRDELIARSNELEAALKSAYLSDAGRSEFDQSINNPAKRLSDIVEAAEAAEAEIRDFLTNTENLTPTETETN